MANTENIEAKLAAYVDGELDAADRAEIEQHLAANPQHRKLIEELREARQCLRELPREQAPPEIAEMLTPGVGLGMQAAEARQAAGRRCASTAGRRSAPSPRS